MKKVIMALSMLCFGAVANADLSCQVDMISGPSFELEILGSGTSYEMYATTVGLTGRCIKMTEDFNCTSSLGERITIEPSFGRITWEHNTSGTEQGQINCN